MMMMMDSTSKCNVETVVPNLWPRIEGDQMPQQLLYTRRYASPSASIPILFLSLLLIERGGARLQPSKIPYIHDVCNLVYSSSPQ